MSIVHVLVWIILTLILLFSARRSTALAILCGFSLALRLGIGVVDQVRLFRLPWSGADSEAFYRTALSFAAMPLDAHISAFDPRHADVYPWLLGFVVKLFGTDYFFLRSLNCFLGVYSIVIVYKLAGIFNLPERRRLMAAALFSFFPFSIILSSVLLRETVIAFSLLSGFLYATVFFKTGRLAGMLYALIYFFIASLFHGGLAVAFIMVILMATFAKPEFIHARDAATFAKSMLFRRVLAGIISFSLILFIAMGGYEFSKIGDVSGVLDAVDARISRVANNGAKGESGYPVWLTSNASNPLLLPVRLLYFLGGPFPWDIRDGVDLAASAISFFYLYMVYTVVRMWRISRWFMLCVALLGAVVFAFSIGTDNFGTAIRHRNKFLAPLIVMFLYAKSVGYRLSSVIPEARKSLTGFYR